MNRFVSLLTGNRVLAAGFIWGLAEGSFFFVVPDVFITAVALFSFKASFRQIVAVLLGSVIAGSLLFAWGIQDPDKAQRAVAHVPFLSPAMIEQVDKDFDKYGIWALCKGPISGIPYKAYSVKAGSRVSWPAFLAVSIPARLGRFLLMWALCSALCFPIRSKILERPGWALTAHLVLWSIFYAFYWRGG